MLYCRLFTIILVLTCLLPPPFGCKELGAPANQWFQLKDPRSSHRVLDEFKTLPCLGRPGLSEAEGVGSEAATFALLWKGLPCLGPPGLSEAALLDDITKCWKVKWRVRKEEGCFTNRSKHTAAFSCWRSLLHPPSSGFASA